MDMALDEVISDRQRGGRNRGGRRGDRDRRRDAAPRDGVRKSTRDDSRNIDRDWLHDKYDDDDSRRGGRGGRAFDMRRRRSRSPEENGRSSGTKVRIDNLHYDINETDLEERFSTVGTVTKAEIVYDRAGRSEGRAFVTYANVSAARNAVRDFDGAMAAGQPIRLTVVNSIPTGPRANPFDSAPLSNTAKGRSLFDRVEYPANRGGDESSRDSSPQRRPRASDVSKPPPDGIDRYVPGQGNERRSPRPARPRSEGRRPGTRRDGRGDRGRGDRGRGDRGTARDGRPRKTQEELDAEMDMYFGEADKPAIAAGTNGSGPAPIVISPPDEDEEMIL